MGKVYEMGSQEISDVIACYSAYKLGITGATMRVEISARSENGKIEFMSKSWPCEEENAKEEKVEAEK